MAVNFTLGRFPQSGELKDACSLPFACVVQPFAKLLHLPLDKVPVTQAGSVGRCQECYAYVNQYCHFSMYGWTCAICGGYNDYKAISNRRYARDMGRQQAPELQRGGVEMLCSSAADFANNTAANDNCPEQVPGQPMYIALVDLTCGADFLELVKSGLLAALEAVPPLALFALITFSPKIGLYDCQGPQPSIRYVHTSGEAKGAPTSLGLEEALPLSHLLAPVGACKDCIAAAVDTLEPDMLQHVSSEGSDTSLGTRSFGAALQAVLRCLAQAAFAPHATDNRRQSGSNASTSGGDLTMDATHFAGRRLMAFLAGPPDRGQGSVLKRKLPPAPLVLPDMADITYTSLALGVQPSPTLRTHSNGTSNGRGIGNGSDPVQAEPDPSARQFYEEAASAAAALGVCIDVYAASDEGLGLTFMQPLTSITGGAVFLYPSLDEAALPQDIYKRLSCPIALDGMLRIRTSPEFSVSQAYGQLFQDEQYENLVHITACTPHSTFAFDFQYANAAGFATTVDSPPMVQMVFQYSLLVARPAAWRASNVTHPPDAMPQTRYVVERRMRVVTQALQDWLVRALANYNTNTNRAGSQPGAPFQVDATFEGAETLQAIPRLVYALLRSPMLSPHPSSHPDTRTSLHLLWSSLPPEDLQTAVYPHLSSYQDPDTQAYPRHSLSRAALVTAGAPIFLLDTFTSLILYYTSGYPSSIPFPPPQSSLLRKTIQAMKQSRQISPQLKMFRGGFDDASQFTSKLIEEPDAIFAQGNRQATVGLVAFLEQVKFEIQQFIEHGM
ncbi:hypothetical protein WJX79_006935 [Trebouxia sp. C0005]